MAHEAIILNQYSAMKYLKSTIGEEEVLLQVDFSKIILLNMAKKYRVFILEEVVNRSHYILVSYSSKTAPMRSADTDHSVFTKFKT